MATSSRIAEPGTLSGHGDPIKALYPMVNEEETPLPRCWSSKDKFTYIGLSSGNLRAHYKGHGKSHKDAASVRATHHIPASCGLYYYEVKIISKGRDGYMGIGLSAQGVNMNRLPGWDKNSYGYHGDDGHSFCSSGTGKAYGPTFSTGDVIGCGLNLIDNVCFYTKNGHYLGVAFTNLPPNLYPTVGLQTPGELVDANFGQAPFVFDIGEMMKELRCKIRSTILNFPVPDTNGEWQSMLYKMVSTYLVHHGYCATAEAFAKSTSQDFDEKLTSIKNRQKIQNLVLSGRMGEAIKTVQELYTGLLDNNPNLLFMLKVRQFIEMVNGTDTEVRGINDRSCSVCSVHVKSPNTPSSDTCWTNGSTQPTNIQVQHTSVIQSIKIAMSANNLSSSSSSNSSSNGCAGGGGGGDGDGGGGSTSLTTEELNQRNTQSSVVGGISSSNGSAPIIRAPPPCSSSRSLSSNSSESGTALNPNDSDTEMECIEGPPLPSTDTMAPALYSSDTRSTNGFSNGFSKHIDDEYEDEDTQFHHEDMECEGTTSSRKMCGGNPLAIERMLSFGKELQLMSQKLKRELGKNKQNKKMLEDAFSLLAYNDPWNSPVGWQLDPVQRETVCQSLNSAILESHQLPRRPPLEICMAHTKQLTQLMSRSGLGSCAFASVDSTLASYRQLLQQPQPPQQSTSSQNHPHQSQTQSILNQLHPQSPPIPPPPYLVPPESPVSNFQQQ